MPDVKECELDEALETAAIVLVFANAERAHMALIGAMLVCDANPQIDRVATIHLLARLLPPELTANAVALFRRPEVNPATRYQAIAIAVGRHVAASTAASLADRFKIEIAIPN